MRWPSKVWLGLALVLQRSCLGAGWRRMGGLGPHNFSAPASRARPALPCRAPRCYCRRPSPSPPPPGRARGNSPQLALDTVPGSRRGIVCPVRCRAASRCASAGERRPARGEKREGDVAAPRRCRRRNRLPIWPRWRGRLGWMREDAGSRLPSPAFGAVEERRDATQRRPRNWAPPGPAPPRRENTRGAAGSRKSTSGPGVVAIATNPPASQSASQVSCTVTCVFYCILLLRTVYSLRTSPGRVRRSTTGPLLPRWIAALLDRIVACAPRSRPTPLARVDLAREIRPSQPCPVS